MNAVIVAFTLLAAGTAALAWWSDRFPACVHPEWVDLGDGDAVCEVCSEVFQVEGS